MVQTPDILNPYVLTQGIKSDNGLVENYILSEKLTLFQQRPAFQIVRACDETMHNLTNCHNWQTFPPV